MNFCIVVFDILLLGGFGKGIGGIGNPGGASPSSCGGNGSPSDKTLLICLVIIAILFYYFFCRH